MIKLNGIEIKPTKFPDGTVQVWHVDPLALIGSQTFFIEWDYENDGEFIQLAQLKTLLHQYPTRIIDLHMPYLPYARQDKQVTNVSTFGLATFAMLINGLGFNRVTAYDPHSDAAARLLKDFYPYYPEFEIRDAFMKTRANLLCFPDTGAFEKYGPMMLLPSIHGSKKRDQVSGQILDYHLHLAKNATLESKTILVVDDICDGGATFMALARSLNEAKAQNIHMFVSHGLFTKGIEPLREAGIKRIFTKEGEII